MSYTELTRELHGRRAGRSECKRRSENGRCLSGRQEISDALSFQIDQDGAVAGSLAKGKVADPKTRGEMAKSGRDCRFC
jgi:hypothetical protein